MKLTQRISFLLKTAWNDLFGEEPQGGEPTLGKEVAGETTAGRLNELLDQAQRQLDALRLELANAISHQKRIASRGHEALLLANSLDGSVDDALKTGQDEQARLLLEQANSARKTADELAELLKLSEQHSADLRGSVNDQQGRLDALRQRLLMLEKRENSLELLGELFGAQQSLTRQTDTLQSELTIWEDRISRREDQLAARREWSK